MTQFRRPYMRADSAWTIGEEPQRGPGCRSDARRVEGGLSHSDGERADSTQAPGQAKKGRSLVALLRDRGGDPGREGEKRT